MGQEAAIKDIRLKVDSVTHRAIKIISEHNSLTIEGWIVSLIKQEVQRNVRLASQLSVAVKPSELSAIPAPRDYVYFIRSGEDGPIKIGISKDVGGRLKTLQTSSSERLSLLVAIPADGRTTERSLHSKFAQFRQEGEWFRPDPDLLDHIENLRAEQEVKASASA